MKITFAIILSIIFFSPASFSQERSMLQNELHELTQQLNGDVIILSVTIDKLELSGISNQSLFDQAAMRLNDNYLNPEKEDVSILLIRALGISGRTQYESILNSVMHSKASKSLRKEAKLALTNLPKYYSWNKSLSQLNDVASTSEELLITRLKNGLNSSDDELVLKTIRIILSNYFENIAVMDLTSKWLKYKYKGLSSELQISNARYAIQALGKSKDTTYREILTTISQDELADNQIRKQSIKAINQLGNGEPLKRSIQYLKLNTKNDSVEYAPFLKKGGFTLNGQAFLVQRGGGVVKAAGRRIILDPKTSTSSDWWSKAGKKWVFRESTPDSEKFQTARKTVIANADGEFKFTDLAAGTYYIRTEVTWFVDTTLQGGLVGDIVVIGEDQISNIVLSKLLDEN